MRAPSPSWENRELERRIDAVAKARGTTPARVRRLVGFALLCEVLAEAAARGVIPLFFIKGGVAIELRLGLAARATKDLDIGLCAPAATLVPAFDAALAVGHGYFAFSRRGVARQLDNGAHRLDVAVTFHGKQWATVDVDLATATADAVTDDVAPVALEEVGLASARPVPCLGLIPQLAQKIHALTEPQPRGRENGRARDVLDVLMLIDRLAPSFDDLRVECERVFVERGKHDWPLYSYAFPKSWASVLTALADEMGFSEQNPHAIEARFNTLLARLNGAPSSMNYQYHFLVLQYAPAESNPQQMAFGSPIKTQGSAAYDAFQNLSNDGWRVHSMLEINHRQTNTPELLVLLERPREEANA
jgi:hypothetical protein